MSDSLSIAKVSVKKFVFLLQGMYGEKFLKMYGSISDIPEKSAFWQRVIGGYPEWVAEVAVSRILDGKTKYTTNVPTLPQLRELFDEIEREANAKKRGQCASKKPCYRCGAEGVSFSKIRGWRCKDCYSSLLEWKMDMLERFSIEVNTNMAG